MVAVESRQRPLQVSKECFDSNWAKIFNKTIVPVDKQEVINNKASADDRCYMQGKDDALAELKRDPTVYYTTDRDIDLYNMGYSSGEIK